MNSYFFKLSEKFQETEVTKSFLVRKYNISQSVNIFYEKGKIHAWNVEVLVSIKLNKYICVCKRSLCKYYNVVEKQRYDIYVDLYIKWNNQEAKKDLCNKSMWTTCRNQMQGF